MECVLAKTFTRCTRGISAGLYRLSPPSSIRLTVNTRHHDAMDNITEQLWCSGSQTSKGTEGVAVGGRAIATGQWPYSSVFYPPHGVGYTNCRC